MTKAGQILEQAHARAEAQAEADNACAQLQKSLLDHLGTLNKLVQFRGLLKEAWLHIDAGKGRDAALLRKIEEAIL